MTTEPTPSLASAALAFKRSAFRNGWTTFNVRDEHADEAERRLRAIPHADGIAASDEYTDPIFRARPVAVELPTLPKAAVAAFSDIGEGFLRRPHYTLDQMQAYARAAIAATAATGEAL